MMSQRKILVVEDNQINREILKEILSKEYQVLEASNGLEALMLLKECGAEISLILLDIVMPVMDGYTFLSKIKTDPACRSIPVIVTTQSDSDADEVAALSQGATDFVVKPYKPQIILHRVANIINLRENAAMVNQLQYDRLTGLYNKEFFYRRVMDILAEHSDKKYDIICSDIENFKLINDIFGIPNGDRLLREIAGMYKDLVRDYGICGHLNADRFVCLLEHQWEYTNDMFAQFTSRLNTLPCAKSVVMKWGIYAVEDSSLPAEKMCDRALLAARSIKGQYGKYFACYDDALRNELVKERTITDQMETALTQGQFEIYLQPKYRLRGDSLAGAEALVRWNHPEWGMQQPGSFIPLFEKNGFITSLDQFVWGSACAVMRAWDDQGLPPLNISVNVSRADLYKEDLGNTLLEIVQKHGLDVSRLPLEITESAYTDDPNQIIETVNSLKKLGFVIEMDDFGTGYSSLNMLNQMPLDVLKLDMGFMQNETAKPMNQGILRFIMELARFMGLSVVAEGVETREQLERLREIGCDYVQGYYFARPMPCGDFEQLIKKSMDPCAASWD
ncbi:two-component system response regulator [Diplocloster agilis]|uniref:Stage 0 sporulation protein A homolog n=1 Tax=Diplocloster agilis TaxID=2850323 RepID=A0A949K176_9FIRM|nr:EAL domain-containing response regulator [Diplocloster agilis]MBU9737457.1 EAL domain-containing protein [Diplocloster agilis]